MEGRRLNSCGAILRRHCLRLLLLLGLLIDAGSTEASTFVPRKLTSHQIREATQQRHQTVLRTFASDESWEGWNTDVMQKWQSLLPPYQLVRDSDFNDGEPYGIAMFHQIHCIVDIRKHYSSLIEVNGTTDESRQNAKSEKEKAHMAHCFNWLRQSILCRADDTKELLRPGESGGFVDRTKHVCGSSDDLYDLGNGYYAPDDNGDLLWHDRVTLT